MGLHHCKKHGAFGPEPFCLGCAREEGIERMNTKDEIVAVSGEQGYANVMLVQGRSHKEGEPVFLLTAGTSVELRLSRRDLDVANLCLNKAHTGYAQIPISTNFEKTPEDEAHQKAAFELLRSRRVQILFEVWSDGSFRNFRFREPGDVYTS